MTVFIAFEILADGLFLFAASMALFAEQVRLRRKDIFLAVLFVAFCGIARVSVAIDPVSLRLGVESRGYDLAPVNNIAMLLFLFLAVLIANSLYFRRLAAFTLFGTATVFVALIGVRTAVIVLFLGLGVHARDWTPLALRLCALAVLCALFFTPVFRWLKEKLNDDSFPVKLLIGNTIVLLIAILLFVNFDLQRTAYHLQIVAVTILVICAVDALIALYAGKRSAEQKRMAMSEQYIPMVEELITQVRARQHEFNNRLLAVSVAVETADSLEQAKDEISALTRGLQFSVSEKSLLNCDSKIIAGMIFSKIKYAETKRVSVAADIRASLKEKTLHEIDVVEMVGILIDNAVEASGGGETVYLRISRDDRGLSISVSNPHEALSAADFVQMFRRGFTTKTADDGARGYGLHNLRMIVKKYRGKTIAGNETIDGANHVTFGVLLP
jgi:signal transduction histidine kinase